jgi:transposase
MYKRRNRLSTRKQMDLLRMFVAGETTSATAEIVGVYRNTTTGFYMCLRRLIADKLPSCELSGEVEADESYSGGTRKGKRGRGASGKVAVFGLLKRAGKVFTDIVPNARTVALPPDHRGKSDTRQHCLHRLVQGLQSSRSERLSSHANQPFRVLRRQRKSYQWNRKFLESGEASFKEIQRH